MSIWGVFLDSWQSGSHATGFDNPFVERRHAILQWRQLVKSIVMADSKVISQANFFVTNGMGQYDALHISAAMSGMANIFVTTDDRLIKKMCKIGTLPTLLPGEAIALMENWYEN